MNAASTKLVNILTLNNVTVDCSIHAIQAALNRHLNKLARPFIQAQIKSDKSIKAIDLQAAGQSANKYSQELTFKGNAIYNHEIYSVCVGDSICFEKAMFSSGRSGSFEGYCIIEATVLKESYGVKTGQHTFTLLLQNGDKMLIKGRNLYANGVWCSNLNRAERSNVVAEKNARSKVASNFRNEKRIFG